MKSYFTLAQLRSCGLLLFPLILSPYLSAQKVTVSGRVTDDNTARPLEGALVRVMGYEIGRYTDEAGNFSFIVDAEGKEKLALLVAYVGYINDTTEVEVSGQTAVTQNIAMNEVGFTTEDVVVTAARGFEQQQSDVTVSIEVLKQEAVNLFAAPAVDELITQIPGVDNLDGQINIRGSSGFAYGVGSRVMVMLDGLPLLSGDGASAELSLIPVDNLAQIEVLKGASSVLYGSGSVGGVINVITARPGVEPRTNVRMRTTLYDRPANKALDWDGSSAAYEASTHIFHARRIGRLDFTLQTDLIKNSGYRQGTDQEQLRSLLLTRYQPKSIPGLTFGLNASTRLDSSGATLYWDGYFPDTTDFVANGDTTTLVRGGALTPTSDAGATRKQYTQRYTLDPYIKYLTADGNLFWYRGRYLNRIADNNTGQSSRYFIFYNDLMYQRTLLQNKINWISGVTYTYSRATADSLYEGSRDGNSLGVYTQFDGKFGKLNTSLGFRYERVRIDTLEAESQPVLRAGINYEITRGTNVRASFGQAFRVPSIAERYANTTGGGIIVEPSPNLDPETGFTAEVGFRQGFEVKGDRIQFRGYVDAAAFVMDYNDMVEFGLKEVDIDFATLSQRAIFQTINVSRARISGLEFTANALFNSGKWYSNFSGGVTLLDPENLNATEPQNQLDLVPIANRINEAQASGNGLAFLAAVNDLVELTSNEDVSDNPEILKYRSRNTVRASATLGYGDVSLTTNFRYTSQFESIDQYLYLVVDDLDYFRTQVNSDGNTVFDFIFRYQATARQEISLNVGNAFNEEYTVIPGLLAPQRRYTLQYLFRF